LKDEKNGVEVQPPDVGTGISQVLPVIVSALYFKEGIVEIEQPELHIHPAFQTILGDLFISQAQKKELIFLLETHSEHLLLRLLRRIRETNDNQLEDGAQGLTPKKLGVYYVENSATGVQISKLEVDEIGEFKDEWPDGFFEEREKELFY
jgi:predicted ATPase